MAAAFALPTILAHRGNHSEMPENTLSAFRAAASAGAKWLEFDVMLSQDRVPVIFHDEAVDALTDGCGLVAAYPLQKLQGLRVYSRGKIGIGPSDRIPTLVDFFAYSTSTDIAFNLEIKANALGPILTCQRILETLQEAGLSTSLAAQQRLLFSSFAREAIVYMAQHAPHIPRAYLIHTDETDALDFAQQQACVSVNFWDQMPGALTFLQRAHAAAMPTLCYTVNDLAKVQYWLQQGVGGIFTDNTDCYHFSDRD